MGLFDKIKKAAKDSMQASGIADVLQKQADDVRLSLKYGVIATPKNLEIVREKEAAERKAKEEAERKAIEEAERRKREEAEQRAQKEAERKAREEAERKAELDRKVFEDAKRKAQMEAELRAMKDAEEKAQEKARQQKLAKEQEEKQSIYAPIKDFVEKAENGDGQAACQIGLWFQHGQKGLPQDMEQAKYWYQQAMVLGNQNAATFLNMLVENEQNQVKTIQKQEETKSQKEDDNRLRLKYDTEDEFLANEKNDGEAAYRIANDCWSQVTKQVKKLPDYAGEDELYSCIEQLDKTIKYARIAQVYYPVEKASDYIKSIIFGSITMKEGLQGLIDRIRDDRRRNRFDD